MSERSDHGGDARITTEAVRTRWKSSGRFVDGRARLRLNRHRPRPSGSHLLCIYSRIESTPWFPLFPELDPCRTSFVTPERVSVILRLLLSNLRRRVMRARGDGRLRWDRDPVISAVWTGRVNDGDRTSLSDVSRYHSVLADTGSQTPTPSFPLFLSIGKGERQRRILGERVDEFETKKYE
jgi:hypothetical protein